MSDRGHSEIARAFVNHIVNVMHNTTEIVDDITKVEGPFLKLAIANMQSHDLGPYLKHLQEMFSPGCQSRHIGKYLD